MSLTCKICVVGNGAIGKVAALSLAQAGWEVVVLAPDAPAASPATVATAEPGWDVRVFALNAVAREVLASIRVWEALDAARVAPVEAMRVFGDGADQLKSGSLGFDAYGARAEALAWIVENRNLDQTLQSALRFAPNVRQVNGRAVRLEQGADQAEITLDNGQRITTELVIGADGAQSWVRGQCDIGLDYRSYAQQALVSNFSCEVPHHGIAYQWFGSAEGVIALLPLPGKQVSLVWSAPEPLAKQLQRESLEQVAERLTALSGHQLGQLQPLQPAARGLYPLNLLRPHAMMAPRVALVGDAAHVVHPLAGQGMNLGFGDVQVLQAILQGPKAQHDCGDPSLLARYQRQRKEEVLLMQLTTDALMRLFAVDLEAVRVLRNAGMQLLDRLSPLKRRLISHALGK